MDMGGSSTQLIFFNGTLDARKVHADDFWAHSWLNYGAHKVQERVLEFIRSNYVAPDNTLDKVCAEDDEERCLDSKQSPTVIIPNPCDFVGHRNLLQGAILEGTGEGRKCFDMIESVVWPVIINESDVSSECFRGRPCPIEEIEHPSVKGHHFYAMSVYFFALDCMREIGPIAIAHW
jgi:hypothetical protein